jgi:hypothetical protein
MTHFRLTRFQRIFASFVLYGHLALVSVTTYAQEKEATYENLDGLTILAPDDKKEYPSTPAPADATILFDG